MSILGTMDVEEAAIEAAGNWKRFDSFAWFRKSEIGDSDSWSIHYTNHRESKLLDRSNSKVIRSAMCQFAEGDDPDLVFESHSHFAVGYIEGFSIRVFRIGQITDAFKSFHQLMERMDNYPILDESDYGEAEIEATYENIPIAAGQLKHEFNLPTDWVDQVYGWLSTNRENALENTSDEGGFPSEEDIEDAFVALGYQRDE